MSPAAGGRLARAVTDAGGLGMIAVGSTDPIEMVASEAALARDGDPDRRFGIGVMGWALAQRPELLAAAIAERPFAINISFGDLAPYASKVKAAGIQLIAQVQSRRWAEAAQQHGVDLVVAQGTEAGGHTGDVGTLPLVQLVLELVQRPVIAAGGIASARGVAAVLAAGAQGAWVGTPFLLAAEARTTVAARARIAAADETQTVLTSLFDRVQNSPWPKEFRGRALANAFSQRWHGHEDELMADESALREYSDAKAAEQYDVANIYAGQSVGMLERDRPAAEIVRDLGEGAELLLRRRIAELLP